MRQKSRGTFTTKPYYERKGASMYIHHENERKSVGDKFEELTKKFVEALDTGNYYGDERKLLKDAIASVKYIKGFFAGKNKLPSLEEDAESTWGMTFDWLRGSYRKIEEAEKLINKPVHAHELKLTNGRSKKATNDMSDFGRNNDNHENMYIPGITLQELGESLNDILCLLQIHM